MQDYFAEVVVEEEEEVAAAAVGVAEAVVVQVVEEEARSELEPLDVALTPATGVVPSSLGVATPLTDYMVDQEAPHITIHMPKRQTQTCFHGTFN